MLVEDERHHLWIGVSRAGLIELSPDRELVNYFKYDPEDDASLSHNTVTRMYTDTQNQMWAATYGGLNRFNGEGFERFLPEPSRNDSLSHEVVQVINQDRDETYWIGTRRGLNLSQDMSRYTRFFHRVEDPRTISNNNVMDIAVDKGNRVWVGTAGGGLNLYHRETGDFSHFDPTMGLPNDYIYRILVDDLGRLWISTNDGLSSYNPESETFTNYDRDDGLQGSEFNPVSWIDEEGQFYFGGIDGLNIFDPLKIKTQAPHSRVTFTDFRMLNKPMAVQPETPLHTAIHLIPQLELEADQDLFSLQFSNMTFSQSKKIRYAYKLEDLDRDWLEADSTYRLATYTRLDGGDYTLRVKSTNSDGVWSPHEAVLKIRVHPPFWKSAPAYLIYALLALGLIWLTVYLLRRDVALERAANLKLEAEVDRQTKALRQKVNELETHDKIVQHINQDVTLEQVTAGILEHGIQWFPEAKDAALILLDTNSDEFKLVTQAGAGIEQPDAGAFDKTLITTRFAREDQCVTPGIYLCVRGEEPAFPMVPNAKSLISMTLEFEGEILGLIIISGNDFDLTSISDDDLTRLSRFRGHVTTAFSKANIMDRLVQAQQQLVESARHAGMAEIATAVLHNVGNILNSVITSSQLMRNNLEGSRLEGLQRAGDMVRESGLSPSDFFEQDKRAHDLFRYLLNMEQPLAKEKKNLLADVDRVIKRVEDIRVVVMAQQSYAAMGFHVEMLDLAEMVENVLIILQNTINNHHIQVEKDFRDAPKFCGERTKIIHIFVNLIKNAIEAMETTPLDQRHLLLSIHEDDSLIHVRVKDRGEGIPSENLARIFQHGFTTKENGHGFGLHSVANSMTEMGGKISVFSNPNGGVCFELSFPRDGDRSG